MLSWMTIRRLGSNLLFPWKINIPVHDCSSQIISMACIHDNMSHLALVEEDVVSAPSIGDMVIHMGLMDTMAEAMKGSPGMALVGLDVDLLRAAMKSDSRRVMFYADDNLVRDMDFEGSSLEGEF